MADRIRVTAPEGEYDIHIGQGLFDQIGQYTTGKPIVITNTTLAALYGDYIALTLPNAAVITMRDGEQYKTLDTVAQLYVDLVEAGLDRSGCVIAMGGGVVGDTAGFAAATYMRGVGLVQVPTSLLAMVDSSVGGKVGVDLPQGKNLVGVFKQPDAVIIDTDLLKTLPEREWRCGMAEAIKHGLLADEGLLDPTLWTRDRSEEFVKRAVQVKVDVVQQDPYERNIRAHLNLGHTFAHAIERVSAYSWLHGEAVGVGIVAAARLSSVLGLCGSELAETVEDVVSSIGLPTRLGDLKADDLLAAMGTDKKWQGGHSRFVLLKGICQPIIVEDVPRATIIHVLKEMAGSP